MSMRSIIRKMFGNAERSFDEFGQPIQDKSMEEKMLEKHLERERKKQIRRQLDYYRKKHWKEMTDMSLPYHKKPRKRRGR